MAKYRQLMLLATDFGDEGLDFLALISLKLEAWSI